MVAVNNLMDVMQPPPSSSGGGQGAITLEGLRGGATTLDNLGGGEGGKERIV